MHPTVRWPTCWPTHACQRLHHAFRAALDEPAVQAVFARFMLPLMPMATAEYEAFAQRTVEAERATLGRLGLLRKD